MKRLAQTAVPNSLFSGGKWIKLETSVTGIHEKLLFLVKNNGFLHPKMSKFMEAGTK